LFFILKVTKITQNILNPFPVFLYLLHKTAHNAEEQKKLKKQKPQTILLVRFMREDVFMLHFYVSSSEAKRTGFSLLCFGNFSSAEKGETNNSNWKQQQRTLCFVCEKRMDEKKKEEEGRWK